MTFIKNHPVMFGINIVLMSLAIFVTIGHLADGEWIWAAITAAIFAFMLYETASEILARPYLSILGWVDSCTQREAEFENLRGKDL